MMFSIATILLAAASVVSAEEFNVVVGKAADGSAANVFSPETVKAKVGDRINFEFHPKNHTVTQSSFAEPCTRQRNTVTQELGVDSGFLSVKPEDTEIPVWIIEVKQDTAPIWMFCNQGNHCNSGMVFAINPPEEGERTFATFKEKAKTANHPDPAEGVTADFTPPPPPGSAPPAASDSAPSESDSAAPTDSSAAPAEPSDATASASGDSTAAEVSSSAAPTVPATPDQANANVSPSPSTSSGSGALSAVRVPGAGIALTLAGLLAGMLL
jgi:plastocyanin